METRTVQLQYTISTDKSHLYGELTAGPVQSSFYINKSSIPGAPPHGLDITIECGEEGDMEFVHTYDKYHLYLGDPLTSPVKVAFIRKSDMPAKTPTFLKMRAG